MLNSKIDILEQTQSTFRAPLLKLNLFLRWDFTLSFILWGIIQILHLDFLQESEHAPWRQFLGLHQDLFFLQTPEFHFFWSSFCPPCHFILSFTLLHTICPLPSHPITHTQTIKARLCVFVSPIVTTFSFLLFPVRMLCSLCYIHFIHFPHFLCLIAFLLFSPVCLISFCFLLFIYFFPTSLHLSFHSCLFFCFMLCFFS